MSLLITQPNQPKPIPCPEPRFDPYLTWSKARGFIGTPADIGIPILVSAKSEKMADSLTKKLDTPPFTGIVRIPKRPKGSCFFTLYVTNSRQIDAVTKLLASEKGTRWETGLPFASPTAFNSPRSRDETPKSKKKQIIGFIDYGCAFAHQQFRNPNTNPKIWSTRVLAIWNQTYAARNAMQPSSGPGLMWRPPDRFNYGFEVWRADTPKLRDVNAYSIDKYLNKFYADGVIDEIACYRNACYPAVEAEYTHGTFVMDLAAGYPDPALPLNSTDCNPLDSDLVFVQLPRMVNGQAVSGLLRTYVLDAIRYIFDCSVDANGNLLPVTINLSYGASGGPHDGTAVLDLAIDEAIRLRRAAKGVTNIVVASGNSRFGLPSTAPGHVNDDPQIHAKANLSLKTKATRFVWQNIPANPTIQYVEIWMDGDPKDLDTCQVQVTLPGLETKTAWVGVGERVEVKNHSEVIAMLIAHKAVYQSNKGRMVLLAVGPTVSVGGCETAPYGDWIIEVKSSCKYGEVNLNLWCERDEPVVGSESGPRQAKFRPGKNTAVTGNLSSTAHGAETIVVGGYVVDSLREADYSSIGPGRNLKKRQRQAQGKNGPEWLAPCEESDAFPGLMAAKVLGTDRIRLNGSSAAAARATRYISSQISNNPALKPASPITPPPVPIGKSIPRVPH